MANQQWHQGLKEGQEKVPAAPAFGVHMTQVVKAHINLHVTYAHTVHLGTSLTSHKGNHSMLCSPEEEMHLFSRCVCTYGKFKSLSPDTLQYVVHLVML